MEWNGSDDKDGPPVAVQCRKLFPATASDEVIYLAPYLRDRNLTTAAESN